jgi:hypothetical protein
MVPKLRAQRRPAAQVDSPAPGTPASAPSLFAGDPPASWRRGLEPAFLLLETELMEQLCARAAAIGTTYDFLLKTIVREHIHKY